MASFEIPARSSDGVPIKKVILDVTSSCIQRAHPYPPYAGGPGKTIRGSQTFHCTETGHDGVATISYAPLEAVLHGPAPADGSSVARVPFETAEGTCHRTAPVEDRKGVTFFVQGEAEVHYDRTKPPMAEGALREAVSRLAGRPVRVALTSGRVLRGTLDPRGTNGIALRVPGDDRVNFLRDGEIADIEPDYPAAK